MNLDVNPCRTTACDASQTLRQGQVLGHRGVVRAGTEHQTHPRSVSQALQQGFEHRFARLRTRRVGNQERDFLVRDRFKKTRGPELGQRALDDFRLRFFRVHARRLVGQAHVSREEVGVQIQRDPLRSIAHGERHDVIRTRVVEDAKHFPERESRATRVACSRATSAIARECDDL